MTVDCNTEITKLIPKLFSIEIKQENCFNFFEKIKTILDFENYYLFLINAENIQLKDSNNYKVIKKDEIVNISKFTTNRLFSAEPFLPEKQFEVINILKDVSKYFLIAKLAIHNAVYGFVLLTGNKKYSKEALHTANAIFSVLSYKIKEQELSNVFKIQSKALKQAVEETHEAYKTIKSQNKKILAADKVKNEFLASVSHELRTPLNAIIGFSDILKTQAYGELNEKQTEYINDIQVSGIQLLGMVNEILDISKLEANAIKIVKRYFEISRPVIETCNLLMPLVKNKNINLTYTIQNDIDIFADYQKIQQIMYNLLSNAIKYTPENGEITITVTNTAKKIKISVKDTGIGIDKKNHKKVFQKFIQLEDAFHKKETSTGLGLTITKQLVELHKGSIKVESEVGQGANFIVTLPIELTDEPLA